MYAKNAVLYRNGGNFYNHCYSSDAYYQNLPENWSLTTLGNIYIVTSSKRVKKAEWTNNGIPFYRAREIVSLKKSEPLKDPIYISEKTYKEKIKVSGSPQKNDILITGVGTLGITYIVPALHKFYFKDGNVIWLKHINKYINSEYTEKYLQITSLKNIIHNTSATTVGTLTIDKTKSLPLLIPPKIEQERIIEFLNVIDSAVQIF